MQSDFTILITIEFILAFLVIIVLKNRNSELRQDRICRRLTERRILERRISERRGKFQMYSVSMEKRKDERRKNNRRKDKRRILHFI